MKENDNEIRDYSAVLEAKYGKKGSLERGEFDEKAYAFYTGQVILEARKNCKITQSELAKRLGVDKSYISKIENGIVNPSVGFFYRVINALNLRVEIVQQIG